MLSASQTILRKVIGNFEISVPLIFFFLFRQTRVLYDIFCFLLETIEDFDNICNSCTARTPQMVPGPGAQPALTANNPERKLSPRKTRNDMEFVRQVEISL